MPGLGGMRDDYNHWDFADVPTPPAFVKDGAVTAIDIFATLGRFGGVDPIPPPGKVNPPGAPVPPPPAYHSAYDRSPAVAPFFPVDQGPPDGRYDPQHMGRADWPGDS